MAFTPTVTWSGGTSSATGFNASPAGSADPRQGDDRIRELKVALAERLSREGYFALVGGSSAGQEGNLRQGAGRVYHQSSAPTTKPDGNALDSDDVGRLYCQSNTTPLKVRTSNSTWVSVAAEAVRSLGGASTTMFCKVINIGDWNMGSSASVSVAHGLTLSKIIGVDAVLRSDGDNYRAPMGRGYTNPATHWGLGVGLTATNVVLAQNTAGDWLTYVNMLGAGLASTDWDATSYNRGFITIWYTP